MSEIWGRLRTCWHVLRGDGVIRGVSVMNGVVTPHRHATRVSGSSEILGNTILAKGPVTFRGDPRYVYGNTGDDVSQPGYWGANG